MCAKSKLAMARNANSEAEVDDSMINLGLLSYPVLQAADVLAYRSVLVLIYILLPLICMTGQPMFPSVKIRHNI